MAIVLHARHEHTTLYTPDLLPEMNKSEPLALNDGL